MTTVSAHKDKALYVLVHERGFFWLTTLATNRHDCYKYAKIYCRTPDYKKELKDDGYKCVRVRLLETTE